MKKSVIDRVSEVVKKWEELNPMPGDSAIVKFNKEQKKKKNSQGPSRRERRKFARIKAKAKGRIKI